MCMPLPQSSEQLAAAQTDTDGVLRASSRSRTEQPYGSGLESSVGPNFGRFTSGAAAEMCAREGRCVQFWSLRPLVASAFLRISCTCRSRALWAIDGSGGSHAAETADLRGDAPHRPRQQAYVGVDAGPPPDQQYNVRGAPQATFLGAGWAALLLVRVLI